MQYCHDLLNEEGILIINLPCSNGVFYKIAEVLERLGISKPLERMWQKEFPSPHLNYFTPDQLSQLAQRNGLAEIHRSSLPSIQVEGLWERLCYDKTISIPVAVSIWLGLIMVIPLLKILPSDISLLIFRKI